MKFKTTAIALAVAGVVATPMAAQAEGSIYASARVGFVNTDTDKGDRREIVAGTNTAGYAANGPYSNLNDALAGLGRSEWDTTSASDSEDDNQWEIMSMASRFGARGETDLGNGMTGFGRYEWDVDFDSSAGVKNRHRYVGVKGDFGSVTIGQTYHTFYNHIVGPLDNPWWGSGYSMVAYVGRTDNAASYAGSAGAIDFGATIYMVSDSEEEDIDTVEAAVSFAVGDLGTVGIGMRAFQGDDDPGTFIDEEEEIIGVTWSGIGIGDTTLGVGYQSRDEDDSIVIDWAIGNAYVHVESLSLDDTDADPQTITLGYTQSLGRNTTMWYEIQATDQDDNVAGLTDVDEDGLIGVGDTIDGAQDFTVIRAILKYDIL